MGSINLPQTRQEYQKEKGQPLQQMVLAKLDSYAQKNEIKPLSHTHTHKVKLVSRPQCDSRNHKNPTKGCKQ